MWVSFYLRATIERRYGASRLARRYWDDGLSRPRSCLRHVKAGTIDELTVESYQRGDVR
jgi:hypothetical protein